MQGRRYLHAHLHPRLHTPLARQALQAPRAGAYSELSVDAQSFSNERRRERLATVQAKQMFLQHRARLTHQIGLVSQFPKLAAENPLPQFMFLGASNVGKSSLLAQVLAPNLKTATKTTNITKNSKKKTKNENSSKTPDIPFVSKRAGFTDTLSVYTLPKRLRLIDSPGYGWKSSARHGELMLEYISEHSELCKMAYILVLSTRGLSDLDKHACELLSHHGVPFKFVVTKCDLIEGARLRNASYNELRSNSIDAATTATTTTTTTTTAGNSTSSKQHTRVDENHEGGIESDHKSGHNRELMQQLEKLNQTSSELCANLGMPQAGQIMPTSTKDGFGVDELRGDMLMLSGLIESGVHI